MINRNQAKRKCSNLSRFGVFICVLDQINNIIDFGTKILEFLYSGSFQE